MSSLEHAISRVLSDCLRFYAFTNKQANTSVWRFLFLRLFSSLFSVHVRQTINHPCG